jgi:putative membrane protein
MKRRWSATVSWAVILVIAVGLETGRTQGASSELDFVSQAAMSNMAAIQLGHIATKKAQNVNVQKFAQTTIDDHLKAQKQLSEAAYGAGVRWPTKLDDRNSQLLQRLSKLSSDQFDREYMKAMIDRHRDIEKRLAARASDADQSALAVKVTQWATKTLPDVRAHLKEAEQVFGELGPGE